MKKMEIDVFDYASEIAHGFNNGILLNSRDQKFDTMIIGWGALGRNWGKPCFTVYVRQKRFTHEQLDANPYFTISVPLEKLEPKAFKVCGTLSGRDVDKVKEAGLHTVPAEKNGVDGIKEAPLTIECRIVYRQDQTEDLYSQENYERWYQNDPAGVHTMYIGEVMDAYIIQDEDQL